MNGRKQNGIVGCASIDDYFNNIIKKHELTRPDKEEDRKNHVRVSNLHYEPVFFAYPQVDNLDAIVNDVISGTPEYDFISDDGIGHTFWVIKDAAVIKQIITEFSKVKYTYVADGHHRTAAAFLRRYPRRIAHQSRSRIARQTHGPYAGCAGPGRNAGWPHRLAPERESGESWPCRLPDNVPSR